MLFFLFTPFFNGENAYAENINFARISKTNAGFYSQPIASQEYILFMLEPTYFVELIEPENSGFYRAKYMDLEGYVESDVLTFVSGIPANPFPKNTNFRIYSLNGLNLRKSPKINEGPLNIITTIPYLENNLIYYGICNGEEAVPYKGDIWYYCKYIYKSEEYYGYVYSVFCDMLKPITINTEQLDEIDKPQFEIETTETSANTQELISSLSKPAQIVIITLVCLPCLLIIYLLFKPTKIANEPSRKKKSKIKRLKKSDYYEFDDYN